MSPPPGLYSHTPASWQNALCPPLTVSSGPHQKDMGFLVLPPLHNPSTQQVA
jgi:hypothetical protein